MPKYFAFLRAVNVGGRNVKMETLRSLFESLDFTNVETFIASGNVIFDSNSGNVIAIKKKIETHLHAALGYEVATFLRTEKELEAISRYNPFSRPDIEAARTLVVGFVDEPIKDDVIKALMAWKSDFDLFHVHQREVYWLSRVGQGESKFSNAVFERILKGKATFRGANTIAKLASKFLSSSDEDNQAQADSP